MKLIFGLKTGRKVGNKKMSLCGIKNWGVADMKSGVTSVLSGKAFSYWMRETEANIQSVAE